MKTIVNIYFTANSSFSYFPMQEIKADGAIKHFCHVFRGDSVAKAVSTIEVISRATFIGGAGIAAAFVPEITSSPSSPVRISIYNIFPIKFHIVAS